MLHNLDLIKLNWTADQEALNPIRREFGDIPLSSGQRIVIPTKPLIDLGKYGNRLVDFIVGHSETSANFQGGSYGPFPADREPLREIKIPSRFGK